VLLKEILVKEGGYGERKMGKTYSKEFEGFRLTTNNRMELLAVIVGLEKLKNQIQKYLLFLIPSMWLIQYEKVGFGWEKKRFFKNADLWKRLLVIYRHHRF
jgi:ribonuclease HI